VQLLKRLCPSRDPPFDGVTGDGSQPRWPTCLFIWVHSSDAVTVTVNDTNDPSTHLSLSSTGARIHGGPSMVMNTRGPFNDHRSVVVVFGFSVDRATVVRF
ncbi:hypothetical protein PanWU01x14_049350, partial [Parasponia andersonii]